ncbi:hypothetical protein [Comamonas aquatica]|uniref:hypothetical protein n=1 Tax=Comamonas aquatica TaxID=225991 RepID=UPI002447860D|nr:hypothetical protein [Comamonas aquatica]MDH0202247.1 hypothetical protein [Comamonas aquatica]MDH1447335.1 hypothetical protein [Comamonas aquatica]
MSNNTQLKQSISQRIQAFADQALRQSALALFSAIGYESDRTIETRSVQDFRDQFDPEGKLASPAAMVDQWRQAELLFQLTDEELSSSAALFKEDAVRTSLLQSYVFIAIELREGDYARGKLANIARQINRIFPMPVMVLFKVGGLLSFAVINRRMNKREENKDVLGKVTLIQSIAIGKPHPGHLDILASFSLTELSADKRSIQNFDQLHAAWEEVFNVELLNKRFYRELANWYFWALPQVDFPADIEKDDEKRRATGLIRLLSCTPQPLPLTSVPTGKAEPCQGNSHADQTRHSSQPHRLRPRLRCHGHRQVAGCRATRRHQGMRLPERWSAHHHRRKPVQAARSLRHQVRQEAEGENRRSTAAAGHHGDTQDAFNG